MTNLYTRFTALRRGINAIVWDYNQELLGTRMKVELDDVENFLTRLVKEYDIVNSNINECPTKNEMMRGVFKDLVEEARFILKQGE